MLTIYKFIPLVYDVLILSLDILKCAHHLLIISLGLQFWILSLGLLNHVPEIICITCLHSHKEMYKCALHLTYLIEPIQ